MIFCMNRINRILPILLLWWNLSNAQPIGSPVAENGKLKVIGNQLVNQSGKPVQLKGMGSHGLQWFSQCYCKSFAQQVFPVLRNVIPDAIIIMATPSYCTQVNEVADNPLSGSLAYNVVYSFHIYAASHDNVIPKFTYASNKTPMFAAEWGVCTYTGNGELDYEATDKWLDMWNGNNFGK